MYTSCTRVQLADTLSNINIYINYCIYNIAYTPLYHTYHSVMLLSDPVYIINYNNMFYIYRKNNIFTYTE